MAPIPKLVQPPAAGLNSGTGSPPNMKCRPRASRITIWTLFIDTFPTSATTFVRPLASARFCASLQARPCRRAQPCARLIRRFRNENLASEHLLDGVEGIHELAQFDNAAFVEPDEIGDEKLNGAIGRALA